MDESSKLALKLYCFCHPIGTKSPTRNQLDDHRNQPSLCSLQ
jgi:hypothetical protein